MRLFAKWLQQGCYNCGWGSYLGFEMFWGGPSWCFVKFLHERCCCTQFVVLDLSTSTVKTSVFLGRTLFIPLHPYPLSPIICIYIYICVHIFFSLLGTNISPPKTLWKMIFLFPLGGICCLPWTAWQPVAPFPPRRASSGTTHWSEKTLWHRDFPRCFGGR